MFRFAYVPLLPLVLLSAACASPEPAGPMQNAQADIDAVNAVRDGFVAAYSAGDADAIGNYYVTDGVSQPNNGPTLKGRDAIVAGLKSMFERSSVKLTLTPEQTQTMGTTGFDSGHYSVEVVPKAGGPTTTSEGRYLVILDKQTDGSWKVTRDMDNAGPPPESSGAPDAPAATESK